MKNLMNYKLLLIILIGIYHSCFAIEVTIPKGYKDKLSAIIFNLDTNKIEYSYNPDVPRLIASNMKLLTTQVVLNNIPSDYRYVTQIQYTGKITNNTLTGDLYIVGSGDPTLSRNNLVKLLNQVKIKHIIGNIYIDNSVFNSYPKYSMLKEEQYDPDTVLPDGLMIDEHLSKFTLHTKNSINVTSNLYGYKIDNKLIINPKLKYCSHNINNDINLVVSGNTIIISGEIAKQCDNHHLIYNLLPADKYNIMAIKYALNQLNIGYTGNIEYKKTPANSMLLSSIKSVKLSKIINKMNKTSNNLYAETLLLTLSSYLTDNTNSYANAKYIYESYIKNNDIYNTEFKLENGAGLSRVEKLSALNLLNMLIIAYNSDTFQVFFDSLPIAGQDGTLIKRFIKLGKKVRFKTGTLNDVSSYSGYFYTKKYHYAVVFTANSIDTTHNKDPKIFNLWVNNLLNKLN